MINKIKINDIVEFTEAEYSTKERKTIKVKKWGIWDGEKVILNDTSKTTVRNLDWLVKLPINSNDDKLKFITKYLENPQFKISGSIDKKNMKIELIGQQDVINILKEIVTNS